VQVSTSTCRSKNGPRKKASPRRHPRAHHRPAFTLGDFGKLLAGLEADLNESSNSQREIRQLLLAYVKTLALSGMRVGEANSLRVRDVEPLADSDGRQTIQFNVRGKTGARAVVPHIDVKAVIDALLERRGDADGDGDEFLFAMPDGSKIITLADQFNAVLDRHNLTRNSSGEKFTLYSLRHFYAVRAITRDVDIYVIARNMGTSVAIIEQYYGKHATSSAKARKLGGESPAYFAPKDSMERPELTEEQKLARRANRQERQLRKKLEARGW
jgi:integrase